jgi:hypothetical protein
MVRRPGDCMKSRAWVVLPLCVALHATRAQIPGTDSAALPISDPKLATTVVARVGPSTITAREFLLSYEFGPAFVKRHQNSKRRYLEFMINEKLLALHAADRGARSSPDVRRSVSEIEGDLATEELYRDDVLNRVRLSEKEIRDAVAAQRVHVSLRWLYSSTRDGIEEYRRMLARGMSFDSLFTIQLGDTVSADLRSWEATRFKVRTLRPSIAAVVDTLKPRTASAPFEGPDGWYIVALHDVTIDALTTASEEAQQREIARRAITQQKGDSLSDIYVNRIMLAHAPVIERRAFDLVGAYLAQFWLPDAMRQTMLKELSVDQETALSAVADVGRFGKEPLVVMKDRTVTLERFLSWYRAREFVLRLRATSVRAYQQSLQQMVWRMVRDDLLIERAMKRGMEKRESVRTQKIWWEEKALYALEKKNLADSITYDDAKLLRYYLDHRRSYRGTNGDTLAFEGVQEQVRKDWYTEELSRRLLHRLIMLKRKYQVKIYDAVLASLPVENENDPRAIETYVAKKGGTFPHPAFPVIDYDWKAWQ